MNLPAKPSFFLKATFIELVKKVSAVLETNLLFFLAIDLAVDTCLLDTLLLELVSRV